MTDTLKRTNEESSKTFEAKFFNWFDRSNREDGLSMYVTIHNFHIRALNTKDRERDEAVAEAVRKERERIINDILNDPEIPIPRPYEVSWILTKLQHAEKLTTPQEGLQDNNKDNEVR